MKVGALMAIDGTPVDLAAVVAPGEGSPVVLQADSRRDPDYGFD